MDLPEFELVFQNGFKSGIPNIISFFWDPVILDSNQNHNLNPVYQMAPRTRVVCNTNTVTPNAKTNGPYALLW